MNIVQLIEKKINGIELTKFELEFIFNDYQENKINEQQISAFLMAILFKGLSEDELFHYTEILIASGDKVIFDDLEKRVDKHSTGGIGDKISLLISPLLAINGIKIAKISGRGLGFTGGTIDKLDSIPGFNYNLSIEEFIALSKKTGISLIATSSNFAPLDKKIYALRDETGSFASKDLIAASIMAKKLLVNSKFIFIDLKCGDGSFFKTYEEAKEMALIFQKLAKKFDRLIFIMITSMNQPLGTYVGNFLEIYEVVNLLNGTLKNDALDLAIHMASIIISKIKNISFEQAKKDCLKAIDDKSAFNKFQEWIESQSGSLTKFNNSISFKTKYQYSIKAESSGFLNFIKTIDLGYGLIELGGGRKTQNDIIDLDVGFKILKKNNDKVSKYEEIIIIYSNIKLSEEFLQKIFKTFEILPNPTNFKQIIEEISW